MSRAAPLVMSLLVAALALACASQTATPLWKTLPNPQPMPVARASGSAPVDGIKLYYAIFGQGPPMILLHGGLANGDYWSNQIAEFSKQHEVIVVDSRGHGRSTRDARPFSYDLMTEDVAALMDYLHVQKASIVGWSDGGIIGIDLAMNYPDRINRLFAFGANTNIAGLKPNLDKNETFNAFIAKAGEDYARLSPTPREYPEFVKQISEMWNTQPDFKPAALAKIAAPTMIADGEYDEAIKREHTEEIAREIPGAKLFIMPGVSHFAHWQQPDAYNKAVLDFIDAKSSRGEAPSAVRR